MLRYLLRNARTTNSRVAAKSAEFLFCLAPRPAACAQLRDSQVAAKSAEFLFCLAPRPAACALLTAVLVIGGAFAQSSPQPAAAPAATAPASTVENWVKKGEEEYKAKQYQEASSSFEEATRLDRKNIEAKLGLANACIRLWATGGKSPAAENSYFRARNTLLDVLDLEPDNKKALAALSRMSLERANSALDRKALTEMLDEARVWNLRLIAIDGNDAAAHYALGVIAWTRCLSPEAQSHNLTIVKRSNPDVQLEVQARLDYRALCQEPVEEGISHLAKALELDKDSDAVMGYLGSLYKMKASYDDSPEDAERDRQSSKEWTAKAEAARNSKAAAGDSAPSSR